MMDSALMKGIIYRHNALFQHNALCLEMIEGNTKSACRHVFVYNVQEKSK